MPLPELWAAGEAWKSKATDTSSGDSRQPRDTTPQWQFEADRVAAQGG